MPGKSLPLRLDDETYHLLKEVADLRGTSMVEIVRESLRSYLPEVVGEETRVLEGQIGPFGGPPSRRCRR